MAAAAKAKKRDRISFEPTADEQIALNLLAKNIDHTIAWILRDAIEHYLIIYGDEIAAQAKIDGVKLSAE